MSLTIYVRHHVLLVRIILLVGRPIKRTSTILNRALSLMNLMNIMTLLVRTDFRIHIFKLLTFPFVLVRPSSLS